MNKDKNIALEVIKRIFKKSKLRTILLLIILLSANTTAWFIYATKVDSSISASVVAWNVSFDGNDNELMQKFNIEVGSIYPGMEPFTKKIEVTNSGEASAKLSYEIVEARILDVEYDIAGGNLTNETLLNNLANDYPFKIEIGSSKEELDPKEGSYFYVNVNWDYESGNDELDTYWGTKAYDFNQSNPDESSISIKLIITATQKEIE